VFRVRTAYFYIDSWFCSIGVMGLWCYGAKPNVRTTVANVMHTTTPTTVGTRNDTSVHLVLPVSLRMVRHVVLHGQCISENSMVHAAVSQVQPFSTNSARSSAKLSSSISAPLDI